MCIQDQCSIAFLNKALDGKSIRQVSELSGVAIQTIRNWINGDAQPTFGAFLAVINACWYSFIMVKRSEEE